MSFSMIFERELLAESLWEYGEEQAAEAAYNFTDGELREVQRVAARRYEADPEPKAGPRLTNGRIIALAGIEFMEGMPRDTTRQRRRTRPREQGYLASR